MKVGKVVRGHSHDADIPGMFPSSMYLFMYVYTGHVLRMYVVCALCGRA